MRIGIDIRNIGKKRTGDEVVFFGLVKNLVHIDLENEYFLFTDIFDEVVLNEIKNELGIKDRANFKIITLKSSNKFVWNSWSLPKYLRKNPVDVYHTQYIIPFFVSRKIKIITTIHDISFNFFPQYIKWSDLLFLKILIPWSLKSASAIIAVSEFTRNEIIKYYKIDPKKVKTIQNAISDNFSINYYSDERKKEVRERYKLPEKFILYIGTMQPRKNIPFLIEAYANIQSKLAGAKLVIAGRKSHNYDCKIDQVYNKLNLGDSLIFPGYIKEDDKPVLFNLASLFVLPSFYEGFGIPIIEAMSQAVPTVASDIPSSREVGMDSVLYFNPSSLASLEEMMYNVFIDENLQKRLIKAGLETSKVFSWKENSQKTLELYKSLNQ
jgi:glycosyltransferase involved in cell wall biosynthesis